MARKRERIKCRRGDAAVHPAVGPEDRQVPERGAAWKRKTGLNSKLRLLIRQASYNCRRSHERMCRIFTFVLKSIFNVRPTEIWVVLRYHFEFMKLFLSCFE